jgi:penicillin-binding protein 1A
MLKFPIPCAFPQRGKAQYRLFPLRRRPTGPVYSRPLDLRAMMNKLLTFLAPFLTRVREFAATIPGRLRHPTWRGALIGLAMIPVLMVLYVLLLIPFTPSISDLQKAKTAKPSIVMSSDGQELASFKRANREWVKLEDISPNVVAALIATEDHRFYDHHGMDIKRTVSSVFHTLTGRKQGGSTITQQLARNLYPEDIGRAATLTRKLKEAITAFKIEAVYTKDEILESYLNTVPFCTTPTASRWRRAPISTNRPKSWTCCKAPRWWACSRARATTTR